MTTLSSTLIRDVEMQLDGSMPNLRIGIDLVPVADVAASVDRFGDRYLHRVFTPHERATCRTTDGAPGSVRAYSAESLAARFAAKEAVVKVLRPDGARPEWCSIEVHRHDVGWCEIRLSGSATAMAAQAGIEQLTVSLTHESMMAAAIVVGMCSSTIRTSVRTVATDWREE